MAFKDEFHDKEYRDAYADTFLDTWIATQLRVLREQRQLTQGRLAKLTGMKQSRISTMENVNYSNWSIQTLKRLAHAFDLPLFVSWGTYGQLVDLTDNFSREFLKRHEFTKDPAFQSSVDPVTSVGSTATVTIGGNVIDGAARFSARPHGNLAA